MIWCHGSQSFSLSLSRYYSSIRQTCCVLSASSLPHSVPTGLQINIIFGCLIMTLISSRLTFSNIDMMMSSCSHLPCFRVNIRILNVIKNFPAFPSLIVIFGRVNDQNILLKDYIYKISTYATLGNCTWGCRIYKFISIFSLLQ